MQTIEQVRKGFVLTGNLLTNMNGAPPPRPNPSASSRMTHSPASANTAPAASPLRHGKGLRSDEKRD